VLEENVSAASEAVMVAVHVRPLIEQELEQGCAECLTVTPGAPQVIQYIYILHVSAEDRELMRSLMSVASSDTINISTCLWPYSRRFAADLTGLHSTMYLEVTAVRSLHTCINDACHRWSTASSKDTMPQ